MTPNGEHPWTRRDVERLPARLATLEAELERLRQRQEEKLLARKEAVSELEEDLEADLEDLEEKVVWTRRVAVATLAAVGGDVGTQLLPGPELADLAHRALQAVGLA